MNAFFAQFTAKPPAGKRIPSGLRPSRDLLERLVQPDEELPEPIIPEVLLIGELVHGLLKSVAPVTQRLQSEDQVFKRMALKATLGHPPRTPRRHAKKRHLGRTESMATTLGSIWLQTYINLASRETTRVTYDTKSSTRDRNNGRKIELRSN
jgi:hypothetical protein